MKYRRMPIEIESPEQRGYDLVTYNLTESSVTDQSLGNLGLDLNSTVLAYGDHLGLKALREVLSSEHEHLGPDDVITTIGAASALFIVATSLLSNSDHLIVVDPNYITNIETPRLIGCEITKIPLSFESGFKLDLSHIRESIQPNTKLISLTSPHNPTGVCLTERDLQALVELAEANDCYLLLDETYRDMQPSPLPILAADLSDRCISVCSLSKSYGLPGIRMGWIMCRNPHLNEIFLAAKEQIFLTHSLVDEHIAHQFLIKKEQFWPAIMAKLKSHKAILKDWIAQTPYFEWIEPTGGCVCFPRVREDWAIDMGAFHDRLNGHYETYVGPGHWFEQPDRYFRIGYGYPSESELREGLKRLDANMRDLTNAAQ